MKTPSADQLLRVHQSVVRRYGGSVGLVSRAALDRVAEGARAARASHEYGVAQVAVIVAVGILREQPFASQNQRAAFFALDTFLRANGKRPFFIQPQFQRIMESAAYHGHIRDLVVAVEQSIRFGEKRANPRSPATTRNRRPVARAQLPRRA